MIPKREEARHVAFNTESRHCLPCSFNQQSVDKMHTHSCFCCSRQELLNCRPSHPNKTFPICGYGNHRNLPASTIRSLHQVRLNHPCSTSSIRIRAIHVLGVLGNIDHLRHIQPSARINSHRTPPQIHTAVKQHIPRMHNRSRSVIASSQRMQQAQTTAFPLARWATTFVSVASVERGGAF